MQDAAVLYFSTIDFYFAIQSNKPHRDLGLKFL